MKNKIGLVQRVEFIKKTCKSKKTLHLGCTNFPYTSEAIKNEMLLHTELGKTCSQLYGFDFDQEGIDVLRESGVENLFLADLENLDDLELDETFEVIIAGEIIEHLTCPGKFLKGIQRFMNKDSQLIITTVNAYCAFRFASYAVRGRGGRAEPVHPDHVAYYSFKTLSKVIEKENLQVSEFYFYDLGTEHRPFNPWYLNIINDASVRFSPQLADGVIAVCQLKFDSEIV